MKSQGLSPDQITAEAINQPQENLLHTAPHGGGVMTPAPSVLTRTHPEPPPSLDRQALEEAALAYLDGGLSIIPVNAWKIPVLEEWKPFQKKRATRDQVKEWLRNPQVAGFAAVGGKVSGGLTILDVDVPGFYERWAAKVGELAQELPTQRTGGDGFQVAFRSTLDVGNEKLAYAPAENREGREIAIETKGEGGYAVLPPSFCHLAEKRGTRHQQPYRVIHGDFGNIPTISEDQARHLLVVARGICQAPLSKKQMQAAPLSPKSNGGAGGVIGAFNAAHDVGAILSRNDYQLKGNRYLAPDSTSGLPGVYVFDNGRCYSHHGNDPLNDGHAHDAFSVFCILAHGGNVTAAVKAAAESLGLSLPDCSIQVSQKTLTLTRKWPDPPAQEAFHGLTGEFVRLVAPHTEADDMALVSQFNTMFGNVIGPNAYYKVERDRHFAKLFSNLVGKTAKARKGTSHGQARYPYEKIDPDWARKRMLGGLSSGEGLIYEVRDPIFRREPEKQNGKATGNYIETEIDPGVADKRLLVYEPEFASVLKVMGRDGNTLSDVIRKAWDSPELRTLTKNSPVHATGAHISIIGHITADELRRYLDRTEMANGFGNRFLWICVKRSKLLPHGGQIDRVDFGPFTQMLQAAVTFARGAGQITMTPAAAEMWTGVYEPLSEGKPGLTGALLARGEAQVIRMAMIYALMDMAHQIDTVHLEAALAFWDYCEASARFIFGDALGDPVADSILAALRSAPDGLRQTAISDLFGRHKSADKIQAALMKLLTHKLIRMEALPTTGRPITIYKAM